MKTGRERPELWGKKEMDQVWQAQTLYDIPIATKKRGQKQTEIRQRDTQVGRDYVDRQTERHQIEGERQTQTHARTHEQKREREVRGRGRGREDK